MKTYPLYIALLMCLLSNFSLAQSHKNKVVKDIRVTEILHRIQDFVKWYHHYKQDSTIDKGYIEFIRNPADTTLAIYDPVGLHRYIASLRAGGFLSERFLQDLEDKFHQVENSGLNAIEVVPPRLNRIFGFDGDVIFDPNSQDFFYNHIVSGINKAKVIYYHFGHKIYIFITIPGIYGQTLPFVLNKKSAEGKPWMIDSIM